MGKRNFRLSNEEKDVLIKLAKKTGMDCWFSMRYGKTEDYVLDIENKKRLTMKAALKQLVDGLTDVDLQCLNYQETLTFIQLLAGLIEIRAVEGRYTY